jgi:threonine dehydrogenase-like Zn-dependent dehydrogenase
MKKLNLVSNGKFCLVDTRKPLLSKNTSIIRLSHVGVCSSDIKRSFGNGAYFFPLVMGHEAMGFVHKSRGNLKEGDKVVIFPLKPCFKCQSCLIKEFQRCHAYSYYGSREDGAYQQFLKVNNWNLLKLPSSINNADAALIEPTAVMVHVKNLLMKLIDNKKLSSQRGAIIGGGFLTMILSRLLSDLGLPDVDIFDRNEYKISFAQSKGINSIHSSELANNKKDNFYDWVIEASGDPKSFQTSIEVANSGGKIIWMSNILGDVSLSATSVSMILRKELAICGSWNSSYSPKGMSDWKETIELIKRGFSPSDFITHYVSLEEIPDILNQFQDHKLRNKKFNAIKAMLVH